MKHVVIVGAVAGLFGVSLFALPRASALELTEAPSLELVAEKEESSSVAVSPVLGPIDPARTAMEAAVAASAALPGVVPVAATELRTLLFEDELRPAADYVARYGSLPNVTVVINEDGTSSSTPFKHGTYAANSGLIPMASFVEYRDALPIQLGCSLVQVDWSSQDAGSFSTISIVLREQGVIFDSLLSNFLSAWTSPGGTGGGSFQPLLPAARPYPNKASGSDTNLYQLTVYEYEIEVEILCDGSTVTYCNSTESASSIILYDIAISTEETIAGNCCIVTVEVGVATGLRSVKLSVGGTGLEFSGALGFKIHEQFSLSECCPEISAEIGDPETVGTH